MGEEVYKTTMNKEPKFFMYDYKTERLRYGKPTLYPLLSSKSITHTFNPKFTKKNYSAYTHQLPWEFLE